MGDIGYLNGVIWKEFRPTQEEAKAGVSGVRTEGRGVRMEVRILYTITHGLHVAWSVSEQGHRLMITGQIPLTPGYLPQTAFDEGKRLAVLFAELWLTESP